MTKLETPKLSGSAQKQLDQAEENFKSFEGGIKNLTLDRMNEAPKLETEPQHQMSQNQIANSKDVYLKPDRVVSARDKFNEKFREQYNYLKQYVPFIAEHSELKGEVIETWTRPFGGMPAEFWKVPTNTPIWGPRYLAEQIKRKSYHRLVMQPTLTNNLGGNQFYGQMAADTTIQRLDAHPVNKSKSVFMSNF